MHKILSLACVLLVASPTQAEKPEEDLQATTEALELSKAKHEGLQQAANKIQVELKELQKKLIKFSEEIQQSESDILATEEKLAVLQTQLDEKNAELTEKKKHLSSLVELSIRLSRTPPEAMVLMPGDPSQTIKAARALKMTSDSMKKQTEEIATQAEALKIFAEKVETSRNELTAKLTALSDERELMKKTIAERAKLQANILKQQGDVRKQLDALSKKAAGLKELVASLEKQKAEKAALEKKKESSFSFAKPKARSFANAKGTIRKPVAGKLFRVFGNQTTKGAHKGITLATRPNAQVSAPYDAEVVFTGPFLNYGKLVILRHSDGYHTLLAGISEILVSPGQFLLEGEPIGAMAEGSETQKLYLELRKDNQPINPAPWFQGLNKET